MNDSQQEIVKIRVVLQASINPIKKLKKIEKKMKKKGPNMMFLYDHLMPGPY
jgi:hypothetical protein